MIGQVSQDGLYYWNGTAWLSTLSPDQRHRWNGSSWVPVPAVPAYPAYRTYPAYQPPPSRVPTAWTRPLQWAVCAYQALTALAAIVFPFLLAPYLSSVMTQAVNQGVQRQAQLDPTYSPPPPAIQQEAASAITSVVDVAFAAGIVVGMAIAIVVVIAAIKRWVWAYYVLLVWLGLSVLIVVGNLGLLAAGISWASLYGVSGVNQPAWLPWYEAIASVPLVALFVFMLVALIRKGPWGMVRPAAAVN